MTKAFGESIADQSNSKDVIEAAAAVGRRLAEAIIFTSGLIVTAGAAASPAAA